MDEKITLNIVGDGPESNKLKKLTKQLKLTKRIHFLGYLPFGKKLFQQYKEANLLIMPSLQDIQGKVYLEAMAFGLPSLVSNVGGVFNIIKNGENGFLLKAGSSQSIIDQFNKINNEIIYQKISKNCYETINKFTVENQINYMMKYIKELVEK